ncbi:MAG: DUF554 domain-containing protein [Thermostichales cyanobacterium SZTDM-1c_bins_54]
MAVPGFGTLVNVLTITAGTGLGWLLGNRLPKRSSETILQVLGCLTIVLGIQMALKANSAAQTVTVLISLVLGAILGEWMDLEQWLERWGQALEAWGKDWLGDSPITQAFVTTSILFVVGPMALLGSIQDGLGDPSLLLIKSGLDGIAAIAFTASLGPGTLFSTLPVLLYQGGLALLAGSLRTLLKPDVVEALTATGGILVMGVGINLLNLKKLRVSNFVPALFWACLLVSLFPLWQK